MVKFATESLHIDYSAIQSLHIKNSYDHQITENIYIRYSYYKIGTLQVDIPISIDLLDQ